jgi:ferredoxin/flavodoxin---NADP+ reductase
VSEIRHFFRLGGYVFKIVHAEFVASGVKRFVMEAPQIAWKQKPGQFVILRIYEEGKRIPVTIAKLISI